MSELSPKALLVRPTVKEVHSKRASTRMTLLTLNYGNHYRLHKERLQNVGGPLLSALFIRVSVTRRLGQTLAESRMMLKLKL